MPLVLDNSMPASADNVSLIHHNSRYREECGTSLGTFLQPHSFDKERDSIWLSERLRHGTLLHTFKGKERTSGHAPPHSGQLRIVTAESLLSHSLKHVQPPRKSFLQSSFQPQTRPTSLSDTPAEVFIHTSPSDYMSNKHEKNQSCGKDQSRSSMIDRKAPVASVSKESTLPSHLHMKTAERSSGEAATSATPVKAPTTTQKIDGQKEPSKEDVEVNDAKPIMPAVVSYPGLVQDVPNLNGGQNSAEAKRRTEKDFTTDNANKQITRGTPKYHDRGRGQGYNNGGVGRPPQKAKWPGKAQIPKGDPGRWKTRWEEKERRWSSSVDSLRADSGFGDDKKREKNQGNIRECAFELTDWSGNWQPAPLDWDSRPAFRPDQNSNLIEQWMEKVEEQMGGRTAPISMENVCSGNGTTFHFAPSLQRPDLLLVGDIAPRYWIPVTINKQAPQTFWNYVVKSDEPNPVDEGDLDASKPWWDSYQIQDGYFLKPYVHPFIKGIDPDETQMERLARESDMGSNYHTQNRKRLELAKKNSERERRKRVQEKASKFGEVSVQERATRAITPAFNLYIRSARPVDMKRICDIYNYYIRAGAYTPETQNRTCVDMNGRYRDVLNNKLPFLVAWKRGQVIKGNHKRNNGKKIFLPDEIVGFAMADDYNDLQGMFRFTAEIEVYTDRAYCRQGVAKCLLDKLMAMLDPEYMERGGYEVMGEELDGVGPSRVIKNIIVNLPYDRPERLEWVGGWLTNRLQFNKVGTLSGIGNKDGKSVDLAIFQRRTGAVIDEANPPIMMDYPRQNL